LKKFKDILQGLTVDDLVLFQLTENGEGFKFLIASIILKNPF